MVFPLGGSPLTGIICMWSGAIVDIPNGWALCDGENDTPDLRDRFIVCAGNAYNPGDKAGAVSHSHLFDTSFDYDNLEYGTEILFSHPDGDWASWTYGHSHYGETDSEDHRPPWYALAFIMKL